MIGVVACAEKAAPKKITASRERRVVMNFPVVNGCRQWGLPLRRESLQAAMSAGPRLSAARARRSVPPQFKVATLISNRGPWAGVLGAPALIKIKPVMAISILQGMDFAQ